MPPRDFNVAARGTARATATRLHNDRLNFSDYDALKRGTTKSKLEKLQKDLEQYDMIIAKSLFESQSQEEYDAEAQVCEEYQDKLLACLHLLSNPVAAAVSNGVSSDQARSYLKSPQAPLPTYKSEPGENFELFVRNFEDTTNKYRYTEYDKFLLLKQQIEGKALFLIESLDPDRQTYAQARELLMNALASRPIQISNIFSQLQDMKLTSSSEPFKYMADMQRILQACKKLDVTVDDILAHFFYNGMNDLFKNQLVLITNNSMPTLEEITDNFFQANERYAMAQSSIKNSNTDKISSSSAKPSSKSSSTYAVDIQRSNNPFHRCPLCDDESHGINKCPNFKTPPEKIRKLQSLDGCLRCSNADHQTVNCKFRFNKSCNSCQAWHFTFICPNAKPDTRSYPDNRSSSAATDAKPKTVSNYSASSNSFFGSSAHDVTSVISTVTCVIDGKKVRAMRDNGSQNNLVSERFLQTIEHVVLEDNIDLTLNGINNSKCFKSKLVRFAVELCDAVRSIECLTVPNLSIDMHIPRLSEVVRAFSDKGYKLSDVELHGSSDQINNVFLILGADSAYCFNDKYVHFGSKSVYIQDKNSVMLIGRIQDLIKNLPFLPSKFSSDNDLISSSSEIKNSSCKVATANVVNKQPTKVFTDEEDVRKATRDFLMMSRCSSRYLTAPSDKSNFSISSLVDRCEQRREVSAKGKERFRSEL